LTGSAISIVALVNNASRCIGEPVLADSIESILLPCRFKSLVIVVGCSVASQKQLIRKEDFQDLKALKATRDEDAISFSDYLNNENFIKG